MVHPSKVAWKKRNPERAKAHVAQWRAKNRSGQQQVAREISAQSRAAVRALVDAAKSIPCAECGLTFDPICMDFDHRPGEVKVRNVSQMRDIEQIKLEIAKCDVVCANCHRLRTKQRGQWGGRRRDPASVETPQLALSLTEEKDRG